MANRCFGKLVAEVLTDARFETVSIVPNTCHHPQRDIDTVVHGDDFVAIAEDGGDGFTWEADPKLVGKLLNMLNLTG